MVKILIIIISFFFGLEGSIVEANDHKETYISDNAGIFEQNFINSQNERIAEIISIHNIPIYIVTSDDDYSGSLQDYTDNLLRERVGIDNDGVILYLNYQYGDLHISTSGRAIDILNDKRLEIMANDVISNARNNPDFMMQNFITSVRNYFELGVEPGTIRVYQKSITLQDIIISFVAGIGTFSIAYTGIKTGSKPNFTKLIFPLIASTLFHLNNNEENLINTRTRTRLLSNYLPSNRSRGAGPSSTIHRSGGGGTFGGKSGKF